MVACRHLSWPIPIRFVGRPPWLSRPHLSVLSPLPLQAAPMPLTVKGPRKASVRHLITLLSGALPILLGVLILYWQAGRTLEYSTAQTAQEAVRQFDLMLDNTALAAQELLPLAG